MPLLERIYGHMPVFLQNIACGLQGLHINMSRFGKGFFLALEEAEERAEWPEERILDYRNQRLQDFIQHCAENIPHFRKRFEKTGIVPASIRSIEDIGVLPVLSRREVQRDVRRFIAENYPASERIMVHTSGSTGMGLRFPTTRSAINEQWAVWWRYRRRHGIQPGTLCAYFGGRSIVPTRQKLPPFWRYNNAGRQILFSGYHLSQGNMPAYIAEIRKRKPPWFHGYPSNLMLVASYIVENDIDLGYLPEWVTVGAENLMPHQARTLEAAFGVRPRQHYGLAEGVVNISECVNGRLHVDEDFSAVEFLPNEGGWGHRMIGTNFTNPVFGLVRYDTGDLVDLEDEDVCCTCGGTGRLVRGIEGRSEDYVTLRNGAIVGRLDHIFKDMVRVREAQIYQPDINSIVLRIVAGEGFSKIDERTLVKEARQRLGDEPEIMVQYCSDLPRTTRGKLKFVVSEVRPRGGEEMETHI